MKGNMWGLIPGKGPPIIPILIIFMRAAGGIEAAKTSGGICMPGGNCKPGRNWPGLITGKTGKDGFMDPGLLLAEGVDGPSEGDDGRCCCCCCCCKVGVVLPGLLPSKRPLEQREETESEVS